MSTNLQGLLFRKDPRFFFYISDKVFEGSGGLFCFAPWPGDERRSTHLAGPPCGVQPYLHLFSQPAAENPPLPEVHPDKIGATQGGWADKKKIANFFLDERISKRPITWCIFEVLGGWASKFGLNNSNPGICLFLISFPRGASQFQPAETGDYLEKWVAHWFFFCSTFLCTVLLVFDGLLMPLSVLANFADFGPFFET